MTPLFALPDLAAKINEWCQEHEIAPASGQAGEFVSERSVRYYRTLGLVDAPEADGYGERHLLQLTAIRILQAHGLPLRKIRELLYGRSDDELREIRRRGLTEAKRVSAGARFAVPGGEELWRATPINKDFILISRRGTSLSASQRQAIMAALSGDLPTSRTQTARN